MPLTQHLPGVFPFWLTDLSCVLTQHMGKYVIVIFTFWGHRYVIVDVYVPLPFSPTVLQVVLEKIAPYCPAKFLIMGDFNAITRSGQTCAPQTIFWRTWGYGHKLQASRRPGDGSTLQLAHTPVFPPLTKPHPVLTLHLSTLHCY